MNHVAIHCSQLLDSIEEIYSPKTVAHFNNDDVRIARVEGEHRWHVHDTTDELYLVLTGRFDIAIHNPDGPDEAITLDQGDIFVMPRGTVHKPSSPGGAILEIKPSGAPIRFVDDL